MSLSRARRWTTCLTFAASPEPVGYPPCQCLARQFHATGRRSPGVHTVQGRLSGRGQFAVRGLTSAAGNRNMVYDCIGCDPESRGQCTPTELQGHHRVCQCPAAGGINDDEARIHDLAYALRSAGIEFHHLYVAGLPIQTSWNTAHPVDSYDIVDIATKVRREGSGREIPRYIIATPLGEADYGLTSTLIRRGDDVDVELRCYDQAYYSSMAPGFRFPEGTPLSETGHPVLRVPGLIKTNDFLVS